MTIHGTTNTSIVKIMFWNCRGYPWDKRLALSDVAQGIDVLFLVEAWEHDTKCIPKIDDYLIKSIWPHSEGNSGCARIACIYHERLDKYIRVCSYNDYKRYLWIEINLGKENPYIVTCS